MDAAAVDTSPARPPDALSGAAPSARPRLEQLADALLVRRLLADGFRAGSDVAHRLLGGDGVLLDGLDVLGGVRVEQGQAPLVALGDVDAVAGGGAGALVALVEE